MANNITASTKAFLQLLVLEFDRIKIIGGIYHFCSIFASFGIFAQCMMNLAHHFFAMWLFMPLIEWSAIEQKNCDFSRKLQIINMPINLSLAKQGPKISQKKKW